MKATKSKRNFNISDEVFDKLKKFCDENTRWNMSVFAEVAIKEKLDRIEAE